jgi:hypothetical protein
MRLDHSPIGIILLRDFPQTRHFLCGIVNTPECQIRTKITSVPIRLIDNTGKHSPYSRY